MEGKTARGGYLFLPIEARSVRCCRRCVCFCFLAASRRWRGGGGGRGSAHQHIPKVLGSIWVWSVCACLLSFLFFLFSFNFFPPKKKALSTTTPFHRLQKTQKKCFISDSNRPPKGTLLRHTRLKIGAITWSTRWRREMR